MPVHTCEQTSRIKTLESNDRSIMDLIKDMRKENKDNQKEIISKVDDIKTSVVDLKLELVKNFPTKEDLEKDYAKKRVETNFYKLIRAIIGLAFTVAGGFISWKIFS